MTDSELIDFYRSHRDVVAEHLSESQRFVFDVYSDQPDGPKDADEMPFEIENFLEVLDSAMVAVGAIADTHETAPSTKSVNSTSVDVIEAFRVFIRFPLAAGTILDLDEYSLMLSMSGVRNDDPVGLPGAAKEAELSESTARRRLKSATAKLVAPGVADILEERAATILERLSREVERGVSADEGGSEAGSQTG